MSPGRRGAVALALVVLLGATASPVAGIAPPATSGAAPAGTIDPVLEGRLTGLAPGDRLPVIATLRDQVDPRAIRSADRRARRRALVGALKRTADVGQAGVRLALGRHASTDVRSVTPLWIVNAVAVTATPRVIRELAARPEVRWISVDSSIAAPEPEVIPAASPPIEANLVQIGAPQLWAIGERGGGALVASLDTGVDLANPDLAAAWRGGSNSWFDPSGQHPTTPADLNGHGTQTLGISVGGSTGGTSIGVAPAAHWIAAKIFNDSGVASSSGIHQAFQWVLDPDANPLTDDAPDVVNASWAIGAPSCDLSFEPDLAALVEAGIVPVFAAGNFGPGGSTSASPANNPSAFAVGAVDGSDAIAGFSSRGPSDCGRAIPATFPTVVAPGVDIRTSDRFGLYGSGSGTSYAAPHVTGAIALLRGALPAATVDELEAALVGSATDLGPGGPDDTFGAGRIDVLAAYDRLLASPTPTPTPTASPTQKGDQVGPVVDQPTVAPNPSNGLADVLVSAVVDDRMTGGTAVDGAELWIDAVGPPGSGRPMSLGSGAVFGTANVSLTAADQAALSEGTHEILVRGHDAAGNWGSLSSSVLIVDRTGPAIGAIHGLPDPSQGTTSISLEATAADTGGAPIGAAEWFSGPDPGEGSGDAMVPSDGAFDGPTETVGAVIPAGPTFGERIVSVRARDAAGNWGSPRSAAVEVTPADGLFADGFETADLSAWSSATGTARLRVLPTAATAGQFGLTATLLGSSPAYVTDTSPQAERVYHARFTLDPRKTSTAGRAIRLLAGRDGRGTTVLSLEYRRTASGCWIRAGARRSGGTSFTRWVRIASGAHAIEIGWSAARSSRLRLWIDGLAATSRGGLDTHAYRIESVRLGPSAGLASGMRGAIRVDRFVSSRGSRICR